VKSVEPDERDTSMNKAPSAFTTKEALMPTLFLGEHRDNIDPIRAGEIQEWEGFKGPATDEGAWVVSAFPQMIYGEVHVGQELTVEEVRVATHLDENEDPEYLLNVKVRNVGLGTIDRYSVNVWIIAP
jgi:hypothetical protein